MIIKHGFSPAGLKDEAVRALVDQLAAGQMPAGAECIYEGRNRILRVPLAGRNVIVKAFCRPNIVNRYIYTTLRRSKARRSLENAERLAALGFSTPGPLAWLERRVGLSLHESYYISEEVVGKDLRRLDLNPEREELMRAFAAEMGRLHRAGVWHKDLTPGNVIYRRVGSRFEFFYIDLNRMSFGVRDRESLLSNLGSIAEMEQTAALGRLYGPLSPFKFTQQEGEFVARDARRRFLKAHPRLKE